jgi:stage II sporulation protein AA (anti-sigma F factor antagonist)
MDINEDRKADVVILAPSGKLDITTAKHFEDKMLTEINSGDRRFIIDLAQLNYISSSGLRVLYRVSAKLKEKGGRIVFCRLNDDVKRVFDIVDRAGDFRVFITRDEAMENLNPVPRT